MSRTAPLLYPDRKASKIVHQLFERIRNSDLTVSEICRKAKVHHDVVGRWRRGETSPNTDTLDRILKVLDAAAQATQ